MKYLGIAILINVTMILTVLVLMIKMQLYTQKFSQLKTKLNHLKVEQILLENKLKRI